MAVPRGQSGGASSRHTKLAVIYRSHSVTLLLTHELSGLIACSRALKNKVRLREFKDNVAGRESNAPGGPEGGWGKGAWRREGEGEGLQCTITGQRANGCSRPSDFTLARGSRLRLNACSRVCLRDCGRRLFTGETLARGLFVYAETLLNMSLFAGEQAAFDLFIYE